MFLSRATSLQAGIVGDYKYCGKANFEGDKRVADDGWHCPRLFLHCSLLRVQYRGSAVEVKLALPADLRATLECGLRGVETSEIESQSAILRTG